MANFLIEKIGFALATIDSSQVNPIGMRQKDEQGNEYIYLKGVASTAAGSWVTFDELGVTALLAADAIGPVAVALAATVASTYGWYLIYGTGSALVAAAFADNGNIYATATAGTVDDAIVAGDRVKNAVGRSAISGGKATVQIRYPEMDDGLVA